MSSKGQGLLGIIVIIFLAIFTLIIFLSAAGVSLSDIAEMLSDISTAIIVIAIGSFLILFGVVFAAKNPRVGRSLSYVGLSILIIGLFIIEMAYVVRIDLPESDVMTQRCSGSLGSSTGLFTNIYNTGDFVSCIVTGYKYKSEYSGWSFFGFWIFGVVTPLLLLMFLFYDFVESSGVIRNPKSKRVVGYSLGVIAYRGFIVSNLLELMSVGTVGIGLLALNLIFAGGLLAYINRVFRQWEPIEAAMGVLRSEITRKHRLRELTKMAIKSCKKGIKPDTILLQEMEALSSDLKWKGLVGEAIIKENLSDMQATLERLLSDLEQNQ